MIFQTLFALTLTAFISVNGQVVEVSTDSVEYQNYIENSVTDIGNPANISFVSEDVLQSDSLVASPTSIENPVVDNTVSGSDAATYTTLLIENNEQEVELLTAAVELLAENSDTATGTVNSSVLTLMDRMIDAYPSYYRYAGFRTSTDDSYASTLYISESAKVSGNTITFGGDCVKVAFARETTNNGYSGYIYYNVSDSPYASVDVNSHSIVYTNCLRGYPTLGNKSFFEENWIWVILFVAGLLILFNRSVKHD